MSVARTIARMTSKDMDAGQVGVPLPLVPRQLTRAGRLSEILVLQRAGGNRAVSKLLQTTTRVQAPVPSWVVYDALNTGRGDPLDSDLPVEMELRFGHQSSFARIRTTARAASARERSRSEHIVTPISSGPVMPGSDWRERDANRASDAVLEQGGPPARQGETEAETVSRATNASAEVNERIAARSAALPTSSRREMEERFGHDFSSVRVGIDAEADRLASSLGAHAFTVGENIAFAEGKFEPETGRGQHLLAHELAHVVQQREAGQAAVALQGGTDRSFIARVRELREALDKAESAGARQPFVQRALQLADSLILAFAVVKGPNPPSGGTSAEEARAALVELGTGLASNGESVAAIQIALKSKDVEVQNEVLKKLRERPEGVAGQQRTLSSVAALAGERIAPAGRSEGSAQWLERRTPAIGRTLKKLDEMGLPGFAGTPKGPYEAPEGAEHSAGLEMSEELLEKYFTVAAHDVKPDPLGKVGGLGTDPKTGQILADCDVYATYGARLLREQGWETVGYLAIVPGEKKPGSEEDRDAHAVAMAKIQNPAGGWTYVGISDWMIRNLSIWSSDENARLMLLRLALEIYTPKLKKYKAYYLPAGPGGALDMRLLDPEKNGLTPFERGGP
jgi:hypothetical protein